MRGHWLKLAGLVLLAGGGVAAQRRAPPTVVVPPPIVESFADERYGSWVVERLGTRSYSASVTNAGGSLLGVLCSGESCVPVFGAGSTCEEGKAYPVLLNAPSGAYGDTPACRKVGKLYLLVLEDLNGIAEAMSIGGIVGIATPMQSGEFKVSRFSLTGSARAYARAAQLARGATPARSEPKAEERL